MKDNLEHEYYNWLYSLTIDERLAYEMYLSGQAPIIDQEEIPFALNEN